MKIALAVDAFPSRSGVTESWPSQVADRLLRRGHQVHVLAREFTAAAPSGVLVHTAGRAGSPAARDAHVEAVLRSLKADIVHNMGLGLFADVFTPPEPAESENSVEPSGGPRLAGFLKRLARRFFSVTVQPGRLAEHPPLDPRTLVAAPSMMAAGVYRTSHPIPPEQLHVVYPGVDIKKFSPHIRPLRRDTTRRKLGVETDEFLLLWVGHNPHRKGLGTALRALRHLAAGERRVRLAAIGGVDCQARQKYAKHLGAADRAIFINQSDLVPYYAAADALILPSRHDPFSLTLLEAAACGLPSIASRADGASELVSDGVDGFLLESADGDEELAARVIDLFDQSRRERMSRAARRMAIGHALDRSIDQLIQLYETIVSQRAAGAGIAAPNAQPLAMLSGQKPVPGTASRRAA